MKGRVVSGWLVALLAAAAGLIAQPALAQQTLTARLTPVVASPRSGAPCWADVSLDSTAAYLIEGYLDVTIRDGLEVVARYRTADLALTNGMQTFRLALPPVTLQGGDSWATVTMRFVGTERVCNLGEHMLFAPTLLKRSFVVGVSTPREEVNPRDSEVAHSLLLGRFDPDPAAPLQRAYSSFPADVAPQDFPAFPLGCCAYDIVFLAGEGFRQMQERQLDALLRWVEGGGSVCVLPRRGLAPYHEEFLAALGVASVPAPPEPPVTSRCGLGRAVVVWDDSAARVALDMPEWRRAVAFLWKTRDCQAAELAEHGRWRLDMQDEAWLTQWRFRSFNLADEGHLDFQRLPLVTGRGLFDTLMPASIRLIPFGLILLLILLFLLAVGPVDYFLLGALRRRRYTWLLFPAMSVGFAAFIAFLSGHYMGGADHRSALIVVDVGEGGRVLRRSSYEMAFGAKEREDNVRLTNALYSPVDASELVRSGYYGMYRDSGYATNVLPRYGGSIPGDFIVQRRVRQWTPLMHRSFSFEPMEPAIDFDWDAVGPADFGSYRERSRLLGRLLPGRQFDGALFCLHESEVHTVQSFANAPAPVEPYRSGDTPEDFIHEISSRPRVGLFSVVSQISPNGAGDFEDVNLLDSTDPRQWLLVAVRRAGADCFVYRRLYFGEP